MCTEDQNCACIAERLRALLNPLSAKIQPIQRPVFFIFVSLPNLNSHLVDFQPSALENIN